MRSSRRARWRTRSAARSRSRRRRRDVAEAAAIAPGGEVADACRTAPGLLERLLERELVAGRDEERLRRLRVRAAAPAAGEEAVDGRRLAVCLDERVQRVVQRAGAVEGRDRLRDARELRDGRIEAEAARELRRERLGVGADDDGHLAGKEQRGDLLEVLGSGIAPRPAAASPGGGSTRARCWSSGLGSIPSSSTSTSRPARYDLERVAPADRSGRARASAARAAARGADARGRAPRGRRRAPRAPERELGFRALLDEREPELLEPRDLLLRERLVAELCERLAAPERERLAEQRRASRRIARARLVDRLRTRARSSCSRSSLTTYPGARVSITSGPSAFRSCATKF